MICEVWEYHVLVSYIQFDYLQKKYHKICIFFQVNKYYDLVTSFYEFGWGESFHFAPR